MAHLPLAHVLRERDALLADMPLVREVEWAAPIQADPYGDADFELSVRELLCDTAAKLCRGQG